MPTNMDKTYAAYWRRHPDEHKRLEMTVFFCQKYDWAVERQDWRMLLAMARWARVFEMPLLEKRAFRAAMHIIPKREKLIWEMLQ